MSPVIPPPVLEVDGLTVSIHRHGKLVRPVVQDVSFSVPAGGILALVGESGSGKTMIGRSVLGLLPAAASVTSGAIRLSDRNLIGIPVQELRTVRGGDIGMVFQEPMVSLNPTLRIGVQMMEALRLHRGMTLKAARECSLDMLARVGIVDPKASLDAYPAEFSGGMRQRIMLASVLATRPKLLIADEPTTALDAIVRKQVMDLMVSLTQEIGTAVLLVSHDLGMVSQYSDQVVVLCGGRLIERGTPDEILLNPRHDYTRKLVGALPARLPAAKPPAAPESPLVEIRDLRVVFDARRKLFARPKARPAAVGGVSLDIRRGEMLAVVGESGSGKTTLGRTLVKLLDKTSGEIRFDGESFDGLNAERLAKFRRQTQMVFQDPYSSLDPHMRLVDIVAEGLLRQDLNAANRRARAAEMLAEVGLDETMARRFPHELSGGQRQRVCIARAVVGQPAFVVADEPVSALDVSVQHQVLELLTRLRAKYGFTVLFISHDLGVVEQIADRVMVMYRGHVVELGSRDAVFDRPQHPYTRRLLAATPRMARRPEGGYVLLTTDFEPAAPPQGGAWFDPATAAGAGPRMIERHPDHWVGCAG